VIIVDEATVRRILTPAACREVLRDAFLSYGRGDVANPLRTVIKSSQGWFASMPAAIGGSRASLGAKLVTAFPENAALGLPTHQAVVVLVDPQTGALQALVDGDAITAIRTAGVSALAARRLASRVPGKVAILGAGVQGHAHIAAFAEAELATSLTIWSRDPARAAGGVAFAQACGLHAHAAQSAQEALREADLIVTATASAEPLFAATAVSEGAFIAAVGACVPSRRELPAQLVAAAAFYVDDVEAARREAGDLLLAERDLGRELPIAGTLGDLLADERRTIAAQGQPVIFESLGLGLEDVACAAYVLSLLG
jgi:ornithine cyclodeaminase/alanine dehydrogenase-like protein (mu-crystallin family)